MQSGSLVVYIGGQTPYDELNGFGLQKDVIYTVDQVGYAIYNGQRKPAIALVERPNEHHRKFMFREIQSPDEVSISALLEEVSKKDAQKVQPQKAVEKQKDKKINP